MEKKVSIVSRPILKHTKLSQRFILIKQMESRSFFIQKMKSMFLTPSEGVSPSLSSVSRSQEYFCNLLSGQEVLRGQQIQVHHFGLSFLLHHWDQEDLEALQSPS